MGGGGVAAGGGGGGGGLLAAQERLVAVDGAVGADDGLEGHPQRVDRAGEVALELGAVLAAEDAIDVAADLGHPVEEDGLLEDADELGGIDRFDQVAIDAVLDGLDRGLDVGTAGDEDHREIGVARADVAEEGDAVHVGHRDVGDDALEALGREPLDRGAAVGARLDVEAGVLEEAEQRAPDVRLVVDDEELASGNRPPARGAGAGDVLGGLVHRDKYRLVGGDVQSTSTAAE